MRTREIHAETARIAAEHGWDQDSPPERYLLVLLTAREDARASLLSAISALQHNLHRLGTMLQQASPVLNSLGELQQQPAAIETAVGMFYAADKSLCAYLESFPPAREKGIS